MHASFFCTLTVFRGVHTLELLRFRLRCFNELRQIIAAFPELTVLKLADGLIESHATTGSHIANAGPPAPTRIRLTQLVLGWDLMPSFLAPLIRWIAHFAACRHLTHLAIWRWPLNIAPEVDELASGVGERLLVFHEFGPSETPDGLCLQMSHESCLVCRN